MPATPTNPLLAELERLSLAYSTRKVSVEILKVYVELLFDVPPWLLRRAVERHVSSSPWFPTISVLRDLCAEIAGTRRFDLLPPFPEDHLAAYALELEERFYQQEELDEAEWERLALACEARGRLERARHVRLRLVRLQQVRSGTAQQAWLRRNQELLRVLAGDGGLPEAWAACEPGPAEDADSPGGLPIEPAPVSQAATRSAPPAGERLPLVDPVSVSAAAPVNEPAPVSAAVPVSAAESVSPTPPPGAAAGHAAAHSAGRVALH